jgi:hypothetical protein
MFFLSSFLSEGARAGSLKAAPWLLSDRSDIATDGPHCDVARQGFVKDSIELAATTSGMGDRRQIRGGSGGKA